MNWNMDYSFEENDNNTNKRSIEEISSMEDEGKPLGIFMEDGGQHEYEVIITCDAEMKLLEEMSKFSKEIEDFFEHVVTNIKENEEDKRGLLQLTRWIRVIPQREEEEMTTDGYLKGS